MGDSRIGGVFRAKGVLSAEVQKIVRVHCERGNAQEMIEKVADFLLSDGIAKGKIPANAGEKTKDLLDRTEAAVLAEATEYHTRGGVLIAKGFVSIQGLAAEMAKQWLISFSAPIPTEHKIKGTLSDPEIQERLTVVALKLREIILQSSNVLSDERYPGYRINNDDLEGICQQAAIAMFRAFEDPNAANHEIIHTRKK